MIPSITVNDVRAQAALNDMRDALIGSGQMGAAATVLEDEFRLLMKQIITLTPPHGLGQDAKRVGEEAVKKDLSKIFTPVDEGVLNDIGSKFGVAGIDTWITGKPSGEKIHLLWDRIDPTGQGIPDFHQSNRNSRGRTRSLKGRAVPGTWKAAYVVAKQDFEEYTRRILSHVGRRKAGWAVAYKALGGHVQRWIDRHVDGQATGEIVNNSKDKNNPNIAAFNSAPGIKDDERIVRDALRVRREAMAKRLKLILSGFSKDMASKIRPRSRAVTTTASADAIS